MFRSSLPWSVSARRTGRPTLEVSSLDCRSVRKPAHLARAAIEAMALQVADVFAAMEADLGGGLDRLSADGGAAINDFLMQFQADVIGRPVLRGNLAEVSAAGAAMLAFAGLGRRTTREQAELQDLQSGDRRA